MYSCPACGAEEVTNRVVCLCGADLSLLQRLDSVADAWFNRALEALKNGEAGLALEWLSACCAARPTDSAARRAQAKIWGQLGHRKEALNALDRAATIEPDAPEVDIIGRALLGSNSDMRSENKDLDESASVFPGGQETGGHAGQNGKKANRKRGRRTGR